MRSKKGDTIMRKRRSFTPEFKPQVVLEILTGTKRMAHVCREYDLKEQVVIRWKAEFLERAPALFTPDDDRTQDQARIAELERLVGRLTMELEIAKKPRSSCSRLRAETAGKSYTWCLLSDHAGLRRSGPAAQRSVLYAGGDG
jgi:transposase